MSNRLEKDYDINQNYNHQDDVISFADILLTLARQIKIIVITPTIICVITLYKCLVFSMPVYTTAKIMSSTGRGEISQAAGIAAQFKSPYPPQALSPYRCIQKLSKAVLWLVQC